MKKNTLFVSVLVGISAVAATVALVFSMNSDPLFTPRGTSDQNVTGEVNYDFFQAMRRNAITGKVEASDYINAVKEVSISKKTGSVSGLQWSFKGPDNVGGRVRSIVVDNENSDIVYAGGSSGGIYVSTNAGGSWTYKSEGWENLQVSTIAQDKDGRLYAGTGMWADAGPTGIGTSFPGGGIWTSTDRGATWSHIASTKPTTINRSTDWAFINRIDVGKTKNAQGNYTIYAATNNGLLVSLDNGATWILPFTHTDCNIVLTNTVQDVVTTENGRVYVAYFDGLYVSDAGETVCSYNKITNGIGSASRTSLTVCENDENIVYAFQSFGGNPSTFQILTSEDAGDSWSPMVPAPPTTVIDSTFDLLATNPVTYNQAIAVDPSNCDRIYVGAVSMYRVDGAWTSVAVNNSFSVPFYVHADKHWFEYDPKDPNTMYVGSDGGVAKTTNSSSSTVTWTENNRHFGTTEYYGVGFSKYGQILGGTQDNSCHLIDPSNVGPAALDATEISSGDGFDVEASKIGDITIVTSQRGGVYRGTYLNGGSFSTTIQNPGSAASSDSPFNTVVRLWESTNDLTSKDSVNFVNDTLRFAVGNGDGNKKFFDGTLNKGQASANIVPGQVKFEDIAGGQVATDSDVPGILKSFGDSIGVIDYATGDFSIRWAIAPPVGSSINSVFNVSFNSGVTLNLKSQNQEYPFDYVLPMALNTGDSIFIQDPVQSLLVVSMNSGLNVTREAVYFPLVTPTWEFVTGITPTCFEFSADGDILYVGGYNGTVMRISGFNDWYHGVVPDSVLTRTTVFTGSQTVSGICVHPTDPEKLLVTTGGYGSGNHVYELVNVMSSTGISSKRTIQGDLPDFPVYDPEYNINHPEQVLIGTELGLWASNDINVTPTAVAWSQESAGVGNVPVFDVRQQWLPFAEASNYGQFYIGTFGRGIWSSTDLVSNEDDKFDDFSSDIEINDLVLYPNPVITDAKVSFDMPVTGNVQISIYDISGKMVTNNERHFNKGEAVYEFGTQNLTAGTYFIKVKVGEASKNIKFVVVK